MTDAVQAVPGAHRSRLVVLAGPTAVGKGTVAAEVRDTHPEVWISVSATTRRPRPGEEDGVHYWFVADEEFDRMVADGELLEWASSTRSAATARRRPGRASPGRGRPAMLEIDLQGARQVRETMPEALFVFLKPPSWTSWYAGWSARAPNPPRSERSASTPRGLELAAEAEFDVTIVNHEVHAAADELVALMMLDLEQPPSTT